MEMLWDNLTTENYSSNTTDWNSTMTTPQQPQWWSENKKIVNKVEIALQCTFLTLGLFGNTTSFILMVRKRWISNVARIIMMALAISDSVMIITHTLNQSFIRKAFGVDPRALALFGCKIFFTFYRTSKMTSSWFIVFLSFERFIAIKRPLQFHNIVSVNRAKIFVLVTYIIIFIFNIILSFSTFISGGICQKYGSNFYNDTTRQAFNLIEMFLYSIGPIVIILTLTPITLENLRQYFKKKQNLHAQSMEQKDKPNADLKRTSIILITMALTFVLTVTPITIYQILAFRKNYLIIKEGQEYHMYLFKVSAQRLELINYSINFFLYLITSPQFRQNFFATFEKCIPNTGLGSSIQQT